MMECKEIQKLFIPFIDDKLSVSDLAAFWIIWTHVKNAGKNMIYTIQ